MTPAHKKLFIVLLILAVLTIGYFLFGKNLIYPPRASEALTIYNIYSRGIDKSSADPNLLAMPTRTVRWKSLPVAVYSQEKIDYLPDLIKEWNQVMNREVFKIGGPDSAIVIKFDSQITPVGIVNIQYNHYLLEKAEIILNPNPNLFSSKEIYHNQDLLKSHLGRALGFFGYTTDDPNGVMDIDQTKHNTKISLLVVSVLDELYKLPLATHGQVDIKLMEAVKKYNIDSRPVDYEYQGLPPIAKPIMPTRTMRWRSLPVAVYDQDNLVPGLQNILNEWNQAMGQDVFIAGGPESPIIIKSDAKVPLAELVIWTPKKMHILDKVEIINHPDWVTPGKIRHQLGHALGFFGHTTDNPDGVMDADYENQKTISPLVVSVLKQLYKLSPNTTIIDHFSLKFENILALRRNVKKYNIDPQSEIARKAGDRTYRWRSWPVSVYSKTPLFFLPEVIKEWNQAMGQDVFIAGGPESPITIEENIYLKTPPYISLHWETEHYLFTKAVIRYNPQYINKDLLKHEFGHVLGFLGDTINDPKGIMDSNYQNLNNALISSLVSSVVKEIHQLPPGVLINY